MKNDRVRTLDDKQQEKSRLWRAFRASKRAEWQALCEVEPRLAGLRSALRGMDDPRAILIRLGDSWARKAPMRIRYAVLREIDRHATRMARREGREPLDDPLPPNTNLFLAARQMLGVR